jgi:magnesium-transporting ATPase (P-type)
VHLPLDVSQVVSFFLTLAFICVIATVVLAIYRTARPKRTPNYEAQFFSRHKKFFAATMGLYLLSVSGLGILFLYFLRPFLGLSTTPVYFVVCVVLTLACVTFMVWKGRKLRSVDMQ